MEGRLWEAPFLVSGTGQAAYSIDETLGYTQEGRRA